MANDLVSAILDSVTAIEVGKALGLNPDRDNRCACPIHNGHDKNFKLYERSFYCFVCHAHGDTIRLVRETLNCDCKAAATWINDTFRLGLDVKSAPTDADRKKAQYAREMRRYKNSLAKKIDAALFDTYLDISDELNNAEADIEQYAPVLPNDEWNTTFTSTLRRINELRELVEQAAMNITKE